jgi:hypothetical protein
VEYLANNGKLGKIIIPNEKYSSLLRKFSSFIVYIGLFKDRVKTI